MDVTVGIALLTTDLDHFRMLLAELHLVFAELLAPHRLRPTVHLLSEEIERLSTRWRPVRDLTRTPPRLASIIHHMNSEKGLELGLRLEAADVPHRRDDPRSDRHSTSFDTDEDVGIDVESLESSRELTLTKLLLLRESIEDLVVRLLGVEEIFDLTLRVKPFVVTEELAHEG